MKFIMGSLIRRQS